MKKFLILLIFLMLASPFSHAETLLCAVDVGKGDALIVVADGRAMLVDAGYSYKGGKILAAMKALGIEKFDYVVLTHTDGDHAGGMEYIAASGIEVGEFVASDTFAKKPSKHPYAKLGIEARYIAAGEEIFPGCAALAPLSLSDEENDNSLVLRVETGDGVMLLTGDMELPEERELLESGADLKCDVLKVANHGDSDASGAGFISAASPDIAVISSDPSEDPDKPGADVLGRLSSSGARIFGTYDGGTVLVTLNEGAASAEYIALPVIDEHPDITVTADRASDTVTLTNGSGADVDLSGWYLYSDKGGEFLYLESALLPARGALVIGSRSTETGYDILWDEKKVLSKKDDERIRLFDLYGDLAAYSE